MASPYSTYDIPHNQSLTRSLKPSSNPSTTRSDLNSRLLNYDNAYAQRLMPASVARMASSQEKTASGRSLDSVGKSHRAACGVKPDEKFSHINFWARNYDLASPSINPIRQCASRVQEAENSLKVHREDIHNTQESQLLTSGSITTRDPRTVDGRPSLLSAIASYDRQLHAPQRIDLSSKSVAGELPTSQNTSNRASTVVQSSQITTFPVISAKRRAHLTEWTNNYDRVSLLASPIKRFQSADDRQNKTTSHGQGDEYLARSSTNLAGNLATPTSTSTSKSSSGATKVSSNLLSQDKTILSPEQTRGSARPRAVLASIESTKEEETISQKSVNPPNMSLAVLLSNAAGSRKCYLKAPLTSESLLQQARVSFKTMRNYT